MNDNDFPDLDSAKISDLEQIGRVRKTRDKDDPQWPDVESASIGRISGMRANANIAWGDTYKAWPIEKRLDYAERLASSMNEAARVLQDERNNLVNNHVHQDLQLKQADSKVTNMSSTLNKEIGRHNAEKQELFKQIILLQATISEQDVKIRRYESR